MEVRLTWDWVLRVTTNQHFGKCFADLPLRECNLVLSYSEIQSCPHSEARLHMAAPNHCCTCRGYKGTHGRHTGLLAGFVEPSLEYVVLQKLPSLSLPSLLVFRLALWSVSSPRFPSCVPYTGISPNKILLASLTLSWCLFLGLFGLTHGVTLDNYFIFQSVT